MRKDEYIAEVISGVKSKSARREIAAELGGHIDELTDFYLERGYSGTEAEETAILEMGDALQVGSDLSRIHPSHSAADVILTALTVISGLYFAFVCPLGIGSYVGYLYHYTLFGEAAFLILGLSMSLYWKKHRCFVRLSLLSFFFIPAVFTYAFYETGTSVYEFCSPTVFYAVYLAMGRFDSISAISNLNIIDVSPAFKIASIVFYIVVFALIFSNLISLIKIGSRSFGPKSRRAFSVISKTTAVFTALITFVFVWAFPLSFVYRNRRYNTSLAFGTKSYTIFVAESDAPVELSELSYRDMVIVTFEDGSIALNYEVPYSDSPLVQKLDYRFSESEQFRYDEFVKYGIDRFEFCLVPEKDYVYVLVSDKDLSCSDVISSYDRSLWLKTGEQYVFKTDDGEIKPNSYITLTIAEKESDGNETGVE